MNQRDVFDHKASSIVENHIRSHDLTVVPYPDSLKDAIAHELRLTWNDAVDACMAKSKSILAITGGRRS